QIVDSPMAAQMPGPMTSPPMAQQMGPPSTIPSTIPGQGPVLPPNLGVIGHPTHPARLPFSYPVAPPGSIPGPLPPGPISATMNIPLHGMAEPGRPSSPGMIGRPSVRDATSTALVQPISYGNGGAMVPQRDRSSPLVRRLKMVVGGAALAAAAAAITIAAIKLAGGGSPASPASASSPPVATKPTVEPIAPAPAPTAPKPAPAKPAVASKPTPAKPAPAPVVVAAAAPSAPAPAPTAPKPAPVVAAVAQPPDPDPEPSRSQPRHTDAARKPDRPDRGDHGDRPDRGDRGDRPDHADRPVEHTADRHAAVAASATARTTDDPPKAERRHTGKSIQDVKADASAQYRSKNFAGAASTIQGALAGFSGADAQELKGLAAIYSQLGKAYNVGMAPGTRATEAYVALNHAVEFDRSLGGAYTAEIKEHLESAATRAASSYMAAKDYESAFQAVRTAERLGSTSSNNKVVRGLLEGIANDLYRDAAASKDSDPDGAKRKARQVLNIVDTTSPLHDKAAKLSASL
ncbi:MAG TPA: hypothetical protein VFP84_07945, partial [Kofleriaceae bacterium]|nr:hypothetical protein [Kofleriaceae bacterium]